MYSLVCLRIQIAALDVLQTENVTAADAADKYFLVDFTQIVLAHTGIHLGSLSYIACPSLTLAMVAVNVASQINKLQVKVIAAVPS